ncbi:autotransporter outer membrane beta-barrel domain-containing protein [Citrobacter sp. RHB20-C16]|uniref:S6 family peptidase n=1 Tax=Citrobacter TaxID=544 RepID=UPI0005C499A1|nr:MULTISPECIES: S6 family peptidase [Citrobacter]MBJ9076584.1 autotransporter outer membrane beta-barrel domain-containing protein [Citrobacter amalonaticus]QMK77368.1 autotransporter outer membrane beta-barrel domain-containing protein [Citrobacter sp. RHB20-C16]QMK81981.1 autotransporter outer membrane beta-barrel domain-containing protein [Citrobacter sp. RHB20-C15]QPB33339.1 autotransporter outer membrane beta-barrel domain-containing protein [Citrobacter amalonaticus]HCC6166272.1 autotra
MNKIYSLKYCPVTQGLIAVSELASRVVKRTSRKLKQISLISISVTCLSYPMMSQAGIVRDDISYQLFRDFAENKGLFVPGATDIPVYDKNGQLVGRLDKAPMADFSSVSTSGVATLISPQYLASVKHNSGYQSVSFGDGKNTYTIVDRNDHPSTDFHAPRLNKLVTEVAPVSVTAEGTKVNAYKNTERYTEFYRVGSGAQYTKDRDGKLTRIAGGYAFKTGGTIGTPLISNGTIVTNPGQTFNPVNGIIPSYGVPGDSGSPLFAYDSLQKKWVMVGVLRSYAGLTGATSWWNVIPTDYLNKVMEEDFDTPVAAVSGKEPLAWHFDQNTGTGTLSQGTTTWDMHGQKGKDLNSGKNLVFSGQNGTILLKDSVTQGAGYLEFKDSYTVSADAGKTWTGAGIITDKGTNVTWKVNGVAGDNLHKLGEGTLTVSGIGVNPGGLKTGDGTVILAQKPDAAGNVQAFSSVNLASGRPTVVLADSRQVNPDNISWGYRGGVLDLNGNDITFTRLRVSDYGAVIANKAANKSHLSLNLSTANNEEVSVPIGTVNPFGGKGTPGSLYSRNLNGQTSYYILKSATYDNTLWGNSLNDPKQWEFVGTDKNKAIQTVKDRVLAERAKQPVIYHGQLTGNMDVTIPQLPGERKVVMDGSVNLPGGNLSKEGGSLIFQGHPVIHASVNGSAPVSLTQKDWENRQFTLKTLSLKNADFHLSRNAVLNGDIQSDNSHITLGSNKVIIDKNDSTGNYVNPEEGTSSPVESQYQGNITLQKGSTLDINNRFTGGIEAHDSQVNVTSSEAVLQDSGIFVNSALSVRDGGHLKAQKGLYSDGRVQIGKNGTLSLSGTPVTGSDGQFTPMLSMTEGYDLTGNNATLDIRNWAHVSGDIHATSPSAVRIGTDAPGTLSSSVSSALAEGMFGGYNAAYYGAITGGKGNVSMNSGLWQLTGDSTVNNLTARNSRVQSEEKGAFRTLTVNSLDATGSDFVLRTDLKNADKISVTGKASGSDNTLNVSFMKNPTPGQSLNIPLVSAPAGTAENVFKAGTRVTGFSRVTPTLHVDTTGGSTKWILDGFRAEADKAAAAKADSFMNAGYKNFMTEVNNLNKRMGELRDTKGDAGAWARIMNGAGSADGGYSDNYTHVQVGFDKKHTLDGVDLFTGVTMTYTDSSADSDAFSGKTKSVGGGLYASALFNSGAYIDLIGKYIHHDNDYTGNFAGLGTKHYGTHSWYAGAETGYRYHLTEDTFIEPQAELVYGAVSGKTFRWKEGNMDLSMKNKDFSPLVGRTGVELGKTFSGKDWSVTARAGTSWQFDLLNNGETVLRDASGEKRIKGEKDSRMLFNVGMNAQIKDNMRFGLEFEKSAFGKYNVDNAINANFRYMF